VVIDNITMHNLQNRISEAYARREKGARRIIFIQFGQLGRDALTIFHLTEVRAPFRVQRKVWVLN